MKRIFLDHNSTTPVDKEVVNEMLPFFNEKFGNSASRNHSFGIEAKTAVDIARKKIAELLNSNANDLIFTSGATESINLALKGFMDSNQDRGKQLITLVTEHKAVLDTCSFLENHGYKVLYLNVMKDGLVNLDELKNAISNETTLISIMHANNEIGVIQPLKEISSICKNHNVKLFVDAAQSVGKIPVDVKLLGADMLAISAHKFYGPKGIGALYINKDSKIKIVSQIDGGGHENGYRSGTLNVPAIVGFGKAAELAAKRMKSDTEKISKLRDRLLAGLQKNIDSITVNGNLSHRLPNNLNISFAGLDGDSLLISIDDIAISNGAACSSSTQEPSYVLRAIGVNENLANASIRFGIGRETTIEEIDYTVQKFKKVVYDLRSIEELKKEMSF